MAQDTMVLSAPPDMVELTGIPADGGILPEFPIVRRLVARSGLGQLPDGFRMFTYPSVDIVGDRVFIRYLRMWPQKMSKEVEIQKDAKLPVMWPRYEEREAEMTGEGVLRIYPLYWFYEGKEKGESKTC